MHMIGGDAVDLDERLIWMFVSAGCVVEAVHRANIGLTLGRGVIKYGRTCPDVGFR